MVDCHSSEALAVAILSPVVKDEPEKQPNVHNAAFPSTVKKKRLARESAMRVVYRQESG